MKGRLEGKVALVTGAGSGIGRGVVERFVAEGARVGALDRSGDRLAELEKSSGGSVTAFVGDASCHKANAGAVRATVEAFGRVDVLVANAGVYDDRARLEDMDPEALDRAFDELFGVNVKGYLLGVRASLEELRRYRGCVILTASVSGFAPGFGGVLYVSAKHAVVGMAKQLAYELAPQVRVNAVAPGYVATGLSGLETLAGSGLVLADPEDVAERMPLGIAPRPGDVAGVYALLASDEGRFMTGSTIVVDGGQSLWGAPD